MTSAEACAIPRSMKPDPPISAVAPMLWVGLDRFGRVIAQSWLDGVTGSTAAGYRPAIVDQIHTYDLASNRLSRRDGRIDQRCDRGRRVGWTRVCVARNA
jgi:hypothetical protein